MKMKILVVTNHGYPALGGLETHVYESCLTISQNSRRINIENLFFGDKTLKNTINESFTCMSVKAGNLFGFYTFPSLLSIYSFIREINSYNPDVIHTHNRYVVSTWIATAYSIIKRIPRIHSEHASNDNYFSSILLRLISNIIDYTFAFITLKSAQLVTCVSFASKKYVETKFHIKKIEVVHNFINAKTLSGKVVNLSSGLEDFLQTKEVIFLWAGRFVDSKNFKFFLSLASKYSKNGKYGFVIVGDGDQKNEVIDYISKNDIESTLYYGGLLKHDELISLMRKCHIYVNSSLLEGLSTTLLEARFLQRLILSSDILPNKEALDGYTQKLFYCHNDDIQQIIESIDVNKFLSDHVKVSKSDKEFPLKFELEHTANKYLTLYTSFASSV